MGKILQTGIALILGFVIIGLFSGALYYGSDDEDKQEFTLYSQYDNNTGEILEDGNVSYQNTNNTVSNFHLIAANVAEAVGNAQTAMQSQSPADMLLGAFGLVSALTMNALFAILAVVIEGVNMSAGILTNLMNLPAPWNILGSVLIVPSITLAFFYLIMKLISAYKGYDL